MRVLYLLNCTRRLSRAARVDLAEGKLLELVVTVSLVTARQRCSTNTYRANTPAPATPRRMLAPAPLKSDLTPSAATICEAASNMDL